MLPLVCAATRTSHVSKLSAAPVILASLTIQKISLCTTQHCTHQLLTSLYRTNLQSLITITLLVLIHFAQYVDTHSRSHPYCPYNEFMLPFRCRLTLTYLQIRIFNDTVRSYCPGITVTRERYGRILSGHPQIMPTLETNGRDGESMLMSSCLKIQRCVMKGHRGSVQ